MTRNHSELIVVANYYIKNIILF